MSSQPQPTPQPQTNFRQMFTQFLSSPQTQQSANGVTLWSVQTMNNAMVRNNVRMTRGHYEAATQSIGRGDGLCSFLQAENLHVLDSTGQGGVYWMGRFVHGAVYTANNPNPSDTGLQG